MVIKRGPYDSPSQRERRKQILLKTRYLLESEGLGGMSMARTAKMSNVSTKTLYNIFVNRELLLLESASKRLDELLLSNTIQSEVHGIPRFLAITAIAMKPFCNGR